MSTPFSFGGSRVCVHVETGETKTKFRGTVIEAAYAIGSMYGVVLDTAVRGDPELVFIPSERILYIERI